MGYLDYAGLQYLWGKLKEKFAPKSHSHDDRYYTESEVNTLLASKVHEETITDARDLNTVKTTGIYHLKTTNFTNGPGITNHGTLIVDYTVGTPYQIYIPDSKNQAFRRNHNNSSSVWNAWSELKFTDTNTWRGIQNNLTSDSTTDSLSAAQGKALKGLVDGKAPNGHTHTKSQVGLGNVDNTADANKSVKYATSAGSASSATKATSADSAVMATASKSIKLFQDSRPTNMNFNLGSEDYNKKITYSIATSSTKEGKPPQDSLVTTYAWDSNGYGAQLAISADANPRMYVRGATNNNGASKWDASWKTIAYTSDKPATAGTADVAKKLSTTAGSATQPVYFKDGVPVATTYTLNKTVPSDAKFTDTNTWRGIQNNLTSDSADQSLSAAQGKVLKGLVDGKLGKNEKATSATTADKATKLATARTVSGGTDITLSFNYDGSGNSNANIEFYNCNHTVQNTNNYPFHRFAKLDANKNAWVDKSMTFLINQDYSGGGYGICRLVYRSNADSSNASVAAEWLVRKGLSADSVQVAIKTDKTNGAYCDAFYKSGGTYSGCSIRALASGGRASQSRTWTLIGSMEASGTTTSDKKNSVECWKTIAEAGTALHNQAYSSSASAVDSGYVNSAGTSNSCTGNAATATGVKDYGDTNKTIKIGYAGAGLTTSNLTHIAGYANNGTQIKDVSKTVLQDWIDLNGMINKLSEATADPQDNDYYISQYSGGGTTTTTYHRRPIKALWNYIKGKTDAAYLKLTGGTMSGALHLKQPNSGSYNENIRMHPSKSDWSSIVMCGSDNTGDSGTSAKTWGIFTNGGKFGISKNGNGVSAVGDASLVCGDNNVWKANGNELITSATIGSQTVSKANSATTASKLGTNAGSTTNPVYFKDGVPVAGTYTLSDASTKTVRTLTAQGPSGWKDAETDQKYVPDMAFMAYWNGAYSGTSSNLQYCDRGRFGTIITKGSGDYLPIGGGTLTGDLKFSDIGDTATSHKISWAGSTDGADIYYQTTAKDQGNLVLNLRDDTNCYLRIASNGAFKSYFSPGDGNFHGNVNGNATSASGYTFKSQTSDPGANSSLATGTVLFVYE